jgi:two-component system LytT family response regulator
MQKPIRTLIVDDEPLARERLRTLLRAEAAFEVVGECADGRSAVPAIRAREPDLLFLDVQMPGLDGFEVLEALGPGEVPWVVFVTAYDQFALRAFEVHAIDYLLKPFNNAGFQRTLRHVKARWGERRRAADPALAALLSDLRGAPPHAQRLVVHEGGKIFFVRFEDIDWLEAAGNYVKIHAGAAEHLVRDTMASMEKRVAPPDFVRIKRSAIVRVEAIQHLEPWFHGEYAITLRSGARLVSSRLYAGQLRALLEGKS